MANKYIIEGATYCGDGTASNEAASAGAVGAWKSTNLDILAGTAPAYGTLAAGDTVYIRSKTSAGGDITRTLAASIVIGSSAATTANWITWIVDNGSVWPGIAGTVTFNCPSTYNVGTRNYNRFIARTQDSLAFVQTNTNASQVSTFNPGPYYEAENILVDQSLNTSGYAAMETLSSGRGTIKNLHYIVRNWTVYCFRAGSYSSLTLINPNIELLRVVSGQPFFETMDYSARIEIIGGRLSGVGATTGCILAALRDSSGGIDMIGFDYPKTMTDTTLRYPFLSLYTAARLSAVGIDKGAGAFLGERWGFADSRDDGNYPTLDSFLPDSVETPWSWRVYPREANADSPCRFPVNMYYTGASAAKTLTLEILLADTITASKKTVWVDVHYIDDTTGLSTYVSSKTDAADALATSTAGWTATTYGPISLVKRKLTLTTPSAIRQDTMVNVVFRTTIKSASANDIFFVNPEASAT